MNPSKMPITPLETPPQSIGIALPQASILSRKLADAVIGHAKQNNVINESDLACPDCALFPILPVTGSCGHTRCTQCIKENGTCPCGVLPPDTLHVNTIVRDLVEKLLQKLARPSLNAGKQHQAVSESMAPSDHSKRMSWRARNRYCPYVHPHKVTQLKLDYVRDTSRPVPMTLQMRYDAAHELISLKRYYEAVPLLAHVAASAEHIAKEARATLDRVVAALIITGDRPRLMRKMLQLIQQYSVNSWLKPRDLECSLCCNPFSKPVTTPCGHSYCHTCLERSLDYWKICPLCMRSMVDYNIFTANETVVITAALRSINAVPPPVQLAPDEIRLLVCTVAYPGVACPLFLLDPSSWVLVRRVLESGRRFGMLSHPNNEGITCNIGTILEIRDCVYFENGSSIISTVGVSRFRVIGKDTKDGCDVARFVPYMDVNSDWKTDNMMRIELAGVVRNKAVEWIKTLDSSVLEQIENSFGKQPDFTCEDTKTWSRSDGPLWLWWIICILPLQIEIKTMLLTSVDLLKRLLTVSRTLDTIKHMSHVINHEDLEWLNSEQDSQD